MSGLVFYGLLVVNLVQYYDSRDGMYITGAWACLILAKLEQMDNKADRRWRA